MPKVASDSHGPYIRHAGQVFRPQRNYTEERIFSKYPAAIRASVTPLTSIPTGALVGVYGYRFVSICVQLRPNLTGAFEVWSEHGEWTGKSEDSWLACKRDIEQEEEAKKPGNIVGEAVAGWLINLLGGIPRV